MKKRRTKAMDQTQTKKLNTSKKVDSRSLWLIALCWLVYTCSYIGKLGYNANVTQIETLYGVSHAEAGTVSTFFFFAYGAGQIVNGLFCKKYNLRFVVFGSLLLSALMNILVGFASSFAVLKFLWLVNGGALSVLWTALIRLLAETLTEERRKTAVIVMGTTVATGTFLTYGMSALFVALGNFQTIFFVAGGLLPVVAVVWLFFYPHLTQKEEFAEKESVETEATQATDKKSGLQGLWIALIIMAVFAVTDNLVKDGLTTWVPSILKETYALPDYVSILLTLFLPVLAIFGATVAVVLQKKIKSFVLICAVLFLTAAALIGAVIGFLPTGAVAVTLISFALVSCLMSGVNNVITSIVPMFWKDKINSGLLAGVLNGFCYLGSTVSAYGLGAAADAWGWLTTFWLLFALCAGCAIVGIVFSILKKGKGETEA